MRSRQDAEAGRVPRSKKASSPNPCPLPIVAKSASEAEELAEPVRMRRRLGRIIETKEKMIVPVVEISADPILKSVANWLKDLKE